MKFFGYNAEGTAGDKAFELRETTIVTESIEEIDSLIEFLRFVKHSHLKETGKCENTSVHTHYRDWENALNVKDDLIIITDPQEKDEAAYTDILAEFTEKLNSDDYKGMGDSEKLEIMVDYLDRAERDPHIAMQVAQGIFYTLDLPDEKKKPHIMKACGIALRFSGDKELRRRASAMMAVVCGDDELEMLSELCLSEVYNEAVEHRLFVKKENERAMEYHYATNVELVRSFLYHGNGNNLSYEYRRAWTKEKIRFLEYLGNGTVPDAYIEDYAYMFVSLAYIEAAEQNHDRVTEYLGKYLDINENKLIKIREGDILRYGNEVFFGDFTRKAELLREDGRPVLMTADIVRKENTKHAHSGLIFHPESLLYHFNDNSAFFSLHGNERFEALKKRAQKLAERWTEENSL